MVESEMIMTEMIAEEEERTSGMIGMLDNTADVLRLTKDSRNSSNASTTLKYDGLKYFLNKVAWILFKRA